MASKTEQEVLAILRFLVENPYPKRGIREIADATGIAYTEAHRYVSREAWERFTLDQIEQMRRYRPSMYLQIIGTARLGEGDKVWLNRSKFPMLLHYAHRNGYRVHMTDQARHGWVVEKVRTDGLYDDQKGSSDPDANTIGVVSHTDF